MRARSLFPHPTNMFYFSFKFLRNKTGNPTALHLLVLETELCTLGSSHHGVGSLCLPQGEGWTTYFILF